MFVHVVLSLLLLLVLLPIVNLTILGATPSTLRNTMSVLIGIAFLLGVAFVPWWFVLAGRDVSGLWIVWGGLVGATIGALAPAFPVFVRDSRLLRRQGYTWGLFGTHQNAKDTLGWDLIMIIFTIVRFGIVTIPVGVLIGVVACSLVL